MSGMISAGKWLETVTAPLGAIASAGVVLALLGAAPVAAELLASGDPGPDSVVLWMRTDVPGAYRFEVAEDAHFESLVAKFAVRVEAKTGFTAQALARGLKPETRYYFRLVRAAGAPLGARGSFATAPLPSEARAVKLLFGADLGGQGYGRLRPGTGLKVDGWPIFVPMLAERADFFVALGDMLYGDRPITAEAPDKGYPKDNDWQIPKPGPGYVSNLEELRRDWLYHRSDRHYDGFLRAIPLVATWDDHEIVNDSGGTELVQGPTAEELARDTRLKQGDPSRPRGEFMPWSTTTSPEGRRRSVFHNPGLYRAGRQAMFEWNPISTPQVSGGFLERRIYRSIRWGAHAEVFVLDVRSYRDPRYRVDTEGRPKTMLGAKQKQWLKEGLASSNATWKLVVSTVPLSLEGGNEKDPQGRGYRDAWARVGDDNPYGYSLELREIVEHLRAAKVANVLFLTGDKHFANLFAYDVDGDGRPDFHEANIGPLRSGPASGKFEFDKAWNAKRLFTDAGKAGFTYGAVAIDGGSGRLVVQFHGPDGAPVSGARLELDPQAAAK